MALAAIGAIAAALAFGAADSQASVTLGETSSNDLQFFAIYASTEVETASGQFPYYTVPADGGEITSWSNQAAVGTEGEMKLKVFRPTDEQNRFAVVGESALETIAPGQLDTFATHIPVQAGDVLGFTRTPGTSMSTFFFTSNAGDMAAQANGADDPLGSTATFAPPQGRVRLDISAVLRQPPGISSIGPVSGSLAGGTQVTISGHDFSGATAVGFGANLASSFVVESDTEITAVSPAGSVGPVDLTVTTPLGASPSLAADRFTYTACVVPRLKGRRLKAARVALTRASCKLGRISGQRRKTSKVAKQSVKPGAVLPPGSEVGASIRTFVAPARAPRKPVLFSKRCASAHYKPREIIIACADARSSFEAHEWTRWDQTGARAVGTFLHADCAPNVPLVACKHNARDRATVKLYRPRFCQKQGRRFFTRLRLSDPESSNRFERNIRLNFPCGYVA